MQLKRPIIRNLISIIIASLFLCVCVYVLLISSKADRHAYAKDDPAKFLIEWSMPLHRARSFGFSPNGKFFYVIADNQFQVYAGSPTRKFSSKFSGVSDAVISPDGRYSLVYFRRNPANRTVTVLDGDGKVYWTTKVDGAVWSADACSTSDGAQFAIGTGDGYVYILGVGNGRKRYRRWRAPGAVVSINILPSGNQVVLGTWQRSSVLCASLRGSRVWEIVAEQANLQNVELLSSANRVLVRSIPNRFGREGVMTLLNLSGRTILKEKISGLDQVRVLASPSGRYICFGYDRDIEHEGKSMRESHSALIDDSGTQLWDKGSSFFPAHPILVTSRGSVLLSSTKNALFTVSRSGDMKASLKLPGDVLHSVPSPDGNSVIIHCGNGRLYKIKAATK